LTKPLECFELAKELRVRHYRDVMRSGEEGRLLIAGGNSFPWELAAGLGDFESLQGEPWGGAIAARPELALECAEATDAWGYGRDVCAYVRVFWGSMFLDRSPWGEFPRPDLAVQLNHTHCGAQGKWFQTVAEYIGIPYFCIDYPRILTDGALLPEEKVRQYVPYLVAQYERFIEWAESATGREYDDEGLLSALIYKRRSQVLWGEICELQQHIPAPLHLRTQLALMMPKLLWGFRKEAADFYAQLLDEVKERVANGIAALAEERARFWFDFVPSYVALDALKYLDQFGAVLVGSLYTFSFGGGRLDDGNWGVVSPFEELGRAPRTREEALRDIAYWDLKRDSRLNMYPLDYKIDCTMDFVSRWKCDGVILQLNRGEKGGCCGALETRLALREAGIPCLVCEGSAADPRDMDPVQVKEGIEAFMESLGLGRR
jgi:benzoyl-CoA reductase subunit B